MLPAFNRLVGAAFAFGLAAASASAQTPFILHDFRGGKDGAQKLPGSAAVLVADANGNLYGTTVGEDVAGDYGSVFELSPPALVGYGWTEQALVHFNTASNGAGPGSLTPDGAGGFSA